MNLKASVYILSTLYRCVLCKYSFHTHWPHLFILVILSITKKLILAQSKLPSFCFFDQAFGNEFESLPRFCLVCVQYYLFKKLFLYNSFMKCYTYDIFITVMCSVHIQSPSPLPSPRSLSFLPKCSSFYFCVTYTHTNT